MLFKSKLMEMALSNSGICFLSASKQRLQLLTIFALSVKYKPEDITLAVSCNMLPVLSHLCGSPTSLVLTNSAVVYNTGQSQLDMVLQVASMRLLQILAITAG